MVGDPGLEPGWVTPHAPQTCASTSSASRPAVSRLILPLELCAMASKVGMRSHDHDDVEAEPFLDESVDLFGDAPRAWLDSTAPRCRLARKCSRREIPHVPERRAARASQCGCN